MLIVDDHATFRATARALLEADGLDVVGEACDGTSALEAVDRLRPELVLLDVQLPDMDGFAVAEALTRRASSPFVVLTSSRDALDLGSLVSTCGARAFVPKAELSGAGLRALIE